MGAFLGIICQSLTINYILVPGQFSCATTSIYTFTYSPLWCTVLGVFIHELCIWPLINLRYPSALKRIGIAAMVIVVWNIGHLCWEIITSHVFVAHSDWFYAVFATLDSFTL